MFKRTALFVLLIAAACAGRSAAQVAAPTAQSNLTLTAPIDTWDEAVPLGNGLTGGLLWGGANQINLSLDRGDLWDLRQHPTLLKDDWTYQTMRRLVKERNAQKIAEYFDHPYNGLTPTKIPGGRLVLTLDPKHQTKTFNLDLQKAQGRIELDEHNLQCFFSAVLPVAMLRTKASIQSLRFVRPPSLNKLGYPEAQFGESQDMRWMVQQTAEQLTYAVVMKTKTTGDATEIAVAVTTNQDGGDPLALGKARVSKALAAGYTDMFAQHRRWWDDFWSASSVTLPDPAIQAHYDRVKYFYGAASRRGAPPMPLQGVWTADTGQLPPWKGDYHHDLNTQTTYLAYHTAGLAESGLSYLDYHWRLLDTYRDFAKKFYGVEGAVIPGVADLAGRPLAGWGMYALSPTHSAWVAQSFDLHWRHTMDKQFLAQRAYPFCHEIALALLNLCETDEAGKLKLPLSSSPEIHDNSLRAWLKPNSNYDLALMRWLFGAVSEMAQALGRQDEAERFQQALKQLDDYTVDENHVLMFSADEPFNQSHRHHSHTMMIHPLGDLNVAGSPSDLQIIEATLTRMQAKGTRAWVGYSFSWFSCILARTGRAEEALKYLVDYERAFTLRNGFHVNGDQSGQGLSGFTYRPFTLEGNFLAMEAVHEMLLQSWSGCVRIFPAVSERWADVSFNDLRARGGFKVSADRRNGQTRRVRIEATVNGLLRLRNPFGQQQATWNRSDLKQQGDDYFVELKAGEALIGENTNAAVPDA